MSDMAELVNTLHNFEYIFHKIKESKNGIYHYNEIVKDFDKELSSKFPECQKSTDIQIRVNYMNFDFQVQFVINTIPILIIDNEQDLTTEVLHTLTLTLMNKLSAIYGIFVNITDEHILEFTRIQNSKNHPIQ